MALTLPNLDDRRWEDLVQEGRSLLPLYAAGWTDHNLHDPGITLMELFAWVTEMDLFRIDQVPPAHRLRFLALLGVTPRPAHGAELPVGFRLGAGAGPVELPAGLMLDAVGVDGEALHYVTTAPLTVQPGTLVAVHACASGGIDDETAAVQRAEPFAPFGADPVAGDALYLGFGATPSAGEPLSLHFEVEGGGAEERRRILERRDEARRCGAPSVCCGEDGLPCACDEAAGAPATDAAAERGALVHPSVRLAWEVAVAPGTWRELSPAAGEIEDATRSLTLSGRVTLRPPVAPASVAIGESGIALPTLRCRVASGSYDAAPSLEGIVHNASWARQEIPAGARTFRVAPDALLEGEPPAAGRSTRLDAELDDDGVIHRLTGGDEGPELFVLGWMPPAAGVDGELVVEAVALEDGTGRPHQALDLPQLIPAGQHLELVSQEGGRWRRWRRQQHLDASGRADADFVLEPEPGDEDGVPATRIRVGDGERGRTLPEHSQVWSAYDATAGAAGQVGPGGVQGLADSARNRAELLASGLLSPIISRCPQFISGRSVIKLRM